MFRFYPPENSIAGKFYGEKQNGLFQGIYKMLKIFKIQNKDNKQKDTGKNYE